MKKFLTVLMILAMVGTAQVALASPFSEAVDALSPVGYWQFENDFSDATANGNDLTGFGTYVGFTDGPNHPGLGDNAIDLRHPGGQSGAYVATGPGDSLNLAGATAYTINAWVSNEEGGGSWGIIAVERDTTWLSGWNYGFSHYILGGNQGLRAWTANLPEISTAIGADVNWHMLTVSATLGGTAEFYVDGAPVGSAAMSGTTIPGDGLWFNVGNNANPVTADYGPSDLNGRIDELAVFDYALSANDVNDLYSTIFSTEATLIGQVELQGFTAGGGNPLDVQALVELQGTGTNTYRQTLDSNWEFTLTGLNPGTYTITINVPGWEPTVLVDEPVSGTTDLGIVALSAGDFDDDGDVTTTDLSILLLNL